MPTLDDLLRSAKASLARADALSREIDADAQRSVEPTDDYDPLGALKRAFRGARDITVPTDRVSDLWEGPKYALQHPIDSASLLLGNLQDTAQAEFEKAQGAATLPEKIGHYAAGALPFIGPAAANTGEAFAEGDTARGVGQTAGLLAPFAVGPLARALKGSSERPIPRVPEPGEARPVPPPPPPPSVSLRERLFGKPSPYSGVPPQPIPPEQVGAYPARTFESDATGVPVKTDSSLPATVRQPYVRPESPLPNPNAGGRLVPRQAPTLAEIIRSAVEEATQSEPAPMTTLPPPVEAPGVVRTSAGRASRGGARAQTVPSDVAALVPEPEILPPPKPRITGDEFAGILRGREKFAEQYPDAALPSGARDRIDRAGLEYGRTQGELKRLLAMPDADPAEVGRMRQGARELGSRLSRGTKELATTGDTTLFSLAAPIAAQAIPDDPNSDWDNYLRAILYGGSAVGLGMAAGRRFTLPKPRALLTEADQLKLLDKTGLGDGSRTGAAAADVPKPSAAITAPEPLPASFGPDATMGPSRTPFQLDPRDPIVEMNAGLAPPPEIRRLVTTPEGRKQLGALAQAHQAGSLLFSPITLGKIGVSNVASALQKAAERVPSEGVAPVARTLRELLNVPRMAADARDAFKNPHTRYSRDATPYPSGGLFGVATRAVGAMDAPFRNAMERAGFSPEDALTVTQQRNPITDFGKSAVEFQQRSTPARLLVPFLKAQMNTFETGVVEPSQAAGRLVRGAGSGADAVKAGSAAAAAGAGYLGADQLDELPRPIRALVLALGGLYSVPAALGYAAGSDAGRGVYQALLDALPLARGFSMDPRDQMGRVVPRTLNPDYWTGTKRETHGLGEQLQSQIPVLAQRLPKKRARAARATSTQAPRASR